MTNLTYDYYSIVKLNNSTSKRLLKGINTPINKLVRYNPETKSVEELS